MSQIKRAKLFVQCLELAFKFAKQAEAARQEQERRGVQVYRTEPFRTGHRHVTRTVFAGETSSRFVVLKHPGLGWEAKFIPPSNSPLPFLSSPK